MALSCLVIVQGAIAQPLDVQVNRWLEVSQVYGTVIYENGQTSQAAQVGMRLQTVGDTLRTSSRSNARLTLDTNAGIITISPNTTVRIEQLQTTASGGRLTRLSIAGGQARFQIQPFSTPDSQLEIQTPAGSSAVRGTEFGISVQPTGSTSVATLEGRVVAVAQGQTILVDAGFQTLMVPGEPPINPVPLTDGAEFRLDLLTEVEDSSPGGSASRRTVQIRGQVNPVNLVSMAGFPQVVDATGQVDARLPVPASRRIEVVVITPSGRQQVYELAIPSKD